MPLQLKKPLAVIDLETTGTHLGIDRIIEIAIVKLLPDGNQVLKRKIINPQMPIPKMVTELHGITDEMVKDAPTFKQVAHELKQMLDSCDLAGYNSNRFDIPMLMEEFLRADVEFEMKSRKLVDVQKIFHLMEQRTLSAAYKFYCNKIHDNGFTIENGIEIFNFGKHKGRAICDVLKAEPQYYDWMMKGDFPMHTKQKLTEIYTRTMLKKI